MSKQLWYNGMRFCVFNTIIRVPEFGMGKRIATNFTALSLVIQACVACGNAIAQTPGTGLPAEFTLNNIQACLRTLDITNVPGERVQLDNGIVAISRDAEGTSNGVTCLMRDLRRPDGSLLDRLCSAIQRDASGSSFGVTVFPNEVVVRFGSDAQNVVHIDDRNGTPPDLPDITQSLVDMARRLRGTCFGLSS